MNEKIATAWKPQEGQKDGDYRLTRKIGSGGMGEVWLAEQVSLDRQVAIKFLLNADNEPTLIERLRTEAKSAARLNHPNIIQVIAFIEFKSCPAVVMEYIEGETLKTQMKNGRRFSLNDIFHLSSQLARGLSAAEKYDVIHRDIKPANLLLNKDDHLKICDFGLARIGQDPQLTQKGTVMGTVHYMSPEQAAGKNVDIRSDFYSMGVILYELLEGQLPFRGEQPMHLLKAHIEDTVPAMSATRVPEPLENFVMRLLDKRAARRPHNTEILLNNIEITKAACLHSANMETPQYHSRRVELKLLNEATQNLKKPIRFNKPQKKITFSALLFVLMLFSLYLVSRYEPYHELTLPTLPDNTRLVYTYQGQDAVLETPLDPQIRLPKGIQNIRFESEFYHDKIIKLHHDLSSLSSMRLNPNNELIFNRMMTLLRQDSTDEVNWDFLDKIYGNKAPDHIKFLRKEINRLRSAKKMFANKEVQKAIALLDTLEYSQTQMTTRNFLKKARIELIPDRGIQNRLTRLRRYIKKGECSRARFELRIIAARQRQSNSEDYLVYHKEIDTIMRFQKKMTLFKDTENLDMDLIKSIADRWGELAPEDPQFIAFNKRYLHEKNRLYLLKQSQDLRKDLDTKHRSWNAWAFHERLLELKKSKAPESLLAFYITDTEKKMSLYFCSALTQYINNTERAKLTGDQKTFVESSYMTSQLEALKELKDLGWENLNIQVTPQSQSWQQNALKVTCTFVIQGDWKNVDKPQKLNHSQSLHFYVKPQLANAVSISKNPQLQLISCESVTP